MCKKRYFNDNEPMCLYLEHSTDGKMKAEPKSEPEFSKIRFELRPNFLVRDGLGKYVGPQPSDPNPKPKPTNSEYF